MSRNPNRSSSAFTLVEIMIVIAIIGLLALIVTPGFIRARQLSQGRAILNDARQINQAIDQWAVDCGKTAGDTVNSASVSNYIKDGPLKTKVAALKTKGGKIKTVLTVNTITIGNVGSTQVSITNAAKKALPAIMDWGDY